jgi:hypothetical protein
MTKSQKKKRKKSKKIKSSGKDKGRKYQLLQAGKQKSTFSKTFCQFIFINAYLMYKGVSL